MEAKSTASSGPSKRKKTRILSRIAEEIRRGRRFLISAHVNPEGDAIGSQLALGLALRSLGKEAMILNQDPTPVALCFLPGAETIRHQAPPGPFDAALALDCGDRQRLGEEFSKVAEIGILINIDHHVSNRFYGEINLVDPGASSAAEIVYDLLRAIPAEISREVAENIYTGILTDTGSFHYSNTTAKTFTVAAACLRAGVDPWRVAQRIYEDQPLSRLRLLPLVLATLELVEEGRVGLITVTQEMMRQAGATPDQTEDFINFPRSLRGTEVALQFREVGAEKYRISLRSRGKVDVARIAEAFQGGGHPNAAGCTLEGSLSQVKNAILERVRANL